MCHAGHCDKLFRNSIGRAFSAGAKEYMNLRQAGIITVGIMITFTSDPMPEADKLESDRIWEFLK